MQKSTHVSIKRVFSYEKRLLRPHLHIYSLQTRRVGGCAPTPVTSNPHPYLYTHPHVVCAVLVNERATTTTTSGLAIMFRVKVVVVIRSGPAKVFQFSSGIRMGLE